MSDGGVKKSYSEELEDSMSNFCFGIFLICFTTMMMWMIERQAVKFAMILSRCQVATRALKNIDVVNKNFEKRSILVKGQSAVQGDKDIANMDKDTGFIADSKSKGNVVRQRRTVEMYQWVETEHRKKEKGKTDVVTYSYKKEWSQSYHDSSRFHEYGHINPPKNPNLESRISNATTYIGAYNLSERQVNMMQAFEPVELSSCPFKEVNLVKDKSLNNVPFFQSKDNISYIVYRGNTCERNSDINNPDIGLVRINYDCIYEDGKVTTVGVLTGNTFRPFTEKDAHGTLPEHAQWLCGINSTNKSKTQKYTDIESPLNGHDDAGSDDDDDDDNHNGGSCSCCTCCVLLNLCAPLLNKCVSFIVGEDVLLLEEKHYSITHMFSNANNSFAYRLKIMRFIAVLLFWVSVSMIFSPISTILGFIPLIGGLASSLFGLLTFILAMILATIVWATSWTAFHPEFLGTVMLTIGLVCAFSTTASAAWVSFGWIFSGLSIIPFTLFLLNWREDCQFAAEQDRLDSDITEHAHEGTGLVANVV